MTELIVTIKQSIAQNISIFRPQPPASRVLIARKNNIEIKYFEISKNQPSEGAGYIQLLNDIVAVKMHVQIKIRDLTIENVLSVLIEDNSKLNLRAPATFL